MNYELSCFLGLLLTNGESVPRKEHAYSFSLKLSEGN
jgi:hypothetical protein